MGCSARWDEGYFLSHRITEIVDFGLANEKSHVRQAVCRSLSRSTQRSEHTQRHVSAHICRSFVADSPDRDLEHFGLIASDRMR